MVPLVPKRSSPSGVTPSAFSPVPRLLSVRVISKSRCGHSSLSGHPSGPSLRSLWPLENQLGHGPSHEAFLTKPVRTGGSPSGFSKPLRGCVVHLFSSCFPSFPGQNMGRAQHETHPLSTQLSASHRVLNGRCHAPRTRQRWCGFPERCAHCWLTWPSHPIVSTLLHSWVP